MNRSLAPVFAAAVLVGALVSHLSGDAIGAVVPMFLLLVGLLSVIVVTRSWVSVPFCILLGIGVRLPFAVLEPVHDDSATYYANAAQLAEGSVILTGHAGVEIVMAIFVFVFGASGANVASFTASIATIPIVGATGAQLFSSRRIGVAAAAAIAVAPLHVYYSSWAYTEPIAICFFSLTFYTIVRKRYGWAILLTGVTFFMRAEYAALILAPLLVLRLSNRPWQRYGTVGAPVVATGLLTLGTVLSPGRDVITIVSDLLNTSLYSVSFLQSLTVDPLEKVSSNALFYVPHFLHWGVPYWEASLVNPFLPVLFIVGTISLLPRTRLTQYGVLLAFGSGVVTFVLRELSILGSRTLVVVSLLLLFGGFCLLVAIGPLSDPRFQPLFALVPYTMLLVVLYLAPRYLLPMMIVGSLYVGVGAVRLYDAVVTDDPWTLRIPVPT